MLQKTLESPLDCKKIQPVHPKENQSRIFIERTDAEAETPILWPPNMKKWFTEKDFDIGKDWEQEEKRVAEHEIVRQLHWFNGYEFEQTPGDSGGQGSLACCNSCGRKESGMLSCWIKYWHEVGVRLWQFPRRGKGERKSILAVHPLTAPRGGRELIQLPLGAGLLLTKSRPSKRFTPVWWLQGAHSPHSASSARHHFSGWTVGQAGSSLTLKGVGARCQSFSSQESYVGQILQALEA